MLARNNEIVELHMFSAFVKTNAKFGGRVAQTLSNLIDQLVNKRRLDREIIAATAETRASAAILLGLMVFLVVLMSVMNPHYFAFYAGSGQGQITFLVILAWPLTGILVMKRILALDF
jgi:tight adherence protein B